MRVFRSLAVTSAILGLAACGTQKKSDDANDQAPKLTSEQKIELEEEFADVPPATIVRVPVDAQGNATGEPEMRVVDNGAAPENDASMTAAWDSGSKPEAMVNSASELDEDSSTQSWQSWGYGSCQYSSYSRCGYGSSFGHGYWNNRYRPVLYRRGYRWNYNRGYHCRLGSYRYYSYRSHRYW